MQDERESAEREALIQLQIARSARSDACKELYQRRKNLPDGMAEFLACKYRVSQAYKDVERAEFNYNRLRVTSSLPAIEKARQQDYLAAHGSVNTPMSITYGSDIYKWIKSPMFNPSNPKLLAMQEEVKRIDAERARANAPTLDDVNLDEEEKEGNSPS